MTHPEPGRYGRRKHRRRGQALVEFALVLPIFLVILSGILDFGFLLFNRMTVINSAREGARAAAMVSDTTTVDSVAKAAAESAAASAGLTLTDANITVTCVKGASTTTTAPCNWNLHSSDPHGAQQGDSVSVSITYQYHTFFPLLMGQSINLSTTVQMVLDSA